MKTGAFFNEELESHRRTFLESLRIKGQAEATLKSRSEALTTFFLWLMRQGINDLREVTREQIRAYQLSLIESKMTAYTRQTKLSGLRRFFEHLETTDTVLLNPCLGMVLPKLADRLPRNVLSQAEAVRILEAPDTQTKKGIRDKAILELFYSTGIRGEEMAQLTVPDVDCKNGFVRVTKGKFAKDRVVPMGSKAAEYIAEYLRQVRGPWSQHQKDERGLWLSAYWPHVPMKKQAIAVLVRDYKKLAGVDRPGRTHLWRHTCATHLVQGGANLAYVQRLLGHRSLDTTQLYTRVSGAEVAQTIKRKHPRARVKT
jgi:integrase/recombinase XerD